MSDLRELAEREPCCSVGYGGDSPRLPWHITWLPEGYGNEIQLRIGWLLATSPLLTREIRKDAPLRLARNRA